MQKNHQAGYKSKRARGRVFILLILCGQLLYSPLAVASPPNPTGKTIKVGLSAALSGPAKVLGRQVKLGIQTYFTKVNQQGGINGQQLDLIAMDDGYIPSVAAANMHHLIDREQVLAVIGNVGTPTAEVTVPIANAKQTLLFGALTGANLLRNIPPDRYVINYRASYAEETAAIIAGLLQSGIRPFEIAFFTQDDAYGDAGYDGAMQALKQSGISDVSRPLHARYKRNTVDIQDGLLTLISARIPPRAIIIVGSYAPSIEFIRLAQHALPHTLFINLSFVGSRSLATALGTAGNRVVITQVVPLFTADLPLVDHYRRDLAAFAPSAKPGFISLEGYIIAHIFTTGLQRSSQPLTRESIIDSIEALGTFDIGLGQPVQYGQTSRQGSHTVWPTIICNGQFKLIDWSQLTQPDSCAATPGQATIAKSTLPFTAPYLHNVQP